MGHGLASIDLEWQVRAHVSCCHSTIRVSDALPARGCPWAASCSSVVGTEVQVNANRIVVARFSVFSSTMRG